MSLDEIVQVEVVLTKHIVAKYRHIKNLKDKDYPKLTGIKSPYFVFTPIESELKAALQSDFLCSKIRLQKVASLLLLKP
jgi:hypothetical protein